jgi:hypothetical protein
MQSEPKSTVPSRIRVKRSEKQRLMELARAPSAGLFPLVPCAILAVLPCALIFIPGSVFLAFLTYVHYVYAGMKVIMAIGRLTT